MQAKIWQFCVTMEPPSRLGFAVDRLLVYRSGDWLSRISTCKAATVSTMAANKIEHRSTRSPIAPLTGGGSATWLVDLITAPFSASPSRIFAGHPWHSRIRPRVYRPFEFVIPGTTDAADEMVGHLRHRQPLRQPERQWLDIEVTGWPAGRAFDLKEFPITREIAESHRARWWWRSATAPIPLAPAR
jgi:hypothetical protein